MIKQNGGHMVFEEFKILIALRSEEVDSTSSILGSYPWYNHGSCNGAPLFCFSQQGCLVYLNCHRCEQEHN